MIRLTRIRTSPPVPPRYCGASREQKERDLLTARLAGDTSFEQSHWKPAKPQLKIESFGKCAYCEARADTVAHGDVEHFRPKDIYWWLAYCYDNYLFSCQICNQSFKSNHFPIHGAALPAPLTAATTAADLAALIGRFAPDPLDANPTLTLVAFAKAAKGEKAALPDPYSIDPEPLLRWHPDADNHWVRVAARGKKVAAKRAFAAADQYLGLNRTELMKERWRTYEKLGTFCESLHKLESAFGAADPTVQNVRGQIVSMLADDAQFAGMARYFVRVEWQLAGF